MTEIGSRRQAVFPIAARMLGTGVHWAPAVAAGDWVFATGLGPYDMLDALHANAVRSPVSSVTPERAQSQATFNLLESALAEAGTAPGCIVRFDQYYTSPKAVDAYHQERMTRLQGRVPPSTSMLMRRLFASGSVLDIQAIGVRGQRAGELEFFNHPHLNGPATSGFCAAVRSGEFVFVPGFTPAVSGDQPSRRGMALEATMPEGSLWKGTPIELETRFLIQKKLAPALELAGASLQTMVKAQVYLTHADDLPGFLRVWSELVGTDGPALTIVPSPQRSIAVEDCRLEVNAIAVTVQHADRRKVIDGGLPRWLEAAPNAIRAGELLFLSGVLPLNADGAIVASQPHPWLAAAEDRVATQAHAVLERARVLCDAAGTALENVVRMQVFLESMDTFPSVHGTLTTAFPSRPLPMSCLEASPPQLPAGALVQTDFWVYCPD